MENECSIIKISRNELHNLIKNKIVSKENLAEYVINNMYSHILETDQDRIKSTLVKFISNYKSKWISSNRMLTRFETKEQVWLLGEIQVNLNKTERAFCSGRSKKNFKDASHRTKLRNVARLLEFSSSSELTFAAGVSLYNSGQRNAAEIVREATQTSPRRAEKIKKAFKNPKSSPVPYTPQQALALYVTAKMTKHGYKEVRKSAKSQNVNIYPSYHKLLEAKKECYPPNQKIKVTEISAEIELQSLLNHTINRLALSLKDVLSQTLTGNERLTLIAKWGCDGSSNHTEYKQPFSYEYLSCSDSDLFAVSFVPLQLLTEYGNNDKKNILWQNPVPCSTRFCRPIKFIMKKETQELTKSEVHHVEEQILNLQDTIISVNNQVFRVATKLYLTMVDGKVCSSLTNISCQKCLICLATPKEMNNKDKLASKIINLENCSFGLSTLHAYIRCFECLLHISYRLEIKKWQAKTSEEKESCKKRKEEIVSKFREQLGLLVDKPKQGTGTTNDGNTARKFFKNSDISSQITGIDKDLINRFSTILNAMSSGFPIDVEKFKKYTENTFCLYIKLYPWYNMPASVHKILVHGGLIIENAILPIGQFSEEAQEARNKDCRRFRLHNSRKFNRVATNEDLIHMLLITSDPFISQLNPIYRNKKILTQDVLDLLKQPDIANTEPRNSKNIESDSSASSENCSTESGTDSD